MQGDVNGGCRVDDVELREGTSTVSRKGRETFANDFYEVIVELLGAKLFK